MAIKALIFDYYGVISTDALWALSGVSPDDGPDEKFHKIAAQHNLGKLNWTEFADRIAQEIGKSSEEVTRAYAQNRLNFPLIDSIRDVKSKYKIALLSNASRTDLEPIFEKSGIDNLFDCLVVSSDVGLVKPDPKIYAIALDNLGVSPDEAVMIDDQIHNVNGAIHAGLSGVHYQNLQQLKSDLSKMGVTL